MLLVCQSTFAWSSLRLVNKIPKTDLVCIALVSLMTVYRDLAQAVGIGIARLLSVSALALTVRKQSTRVKARASDGAELPLRPGATRSAGPTKNGTALPAGRGGAPYKDAAELRHHARGRRQTFPGRALRPPKARRRR